MNAFEYLSDTPDQYLHTRYCDKGYFIKGAMAYYAMQEKYDLEKQKRKEKEREERKAAKAEERARKAGKHIPVKVSVKQTPEERERNKRALQQQYTAKRGKLNSVFSIIHEALQLSAKVLLVNVVLKLPTVDEVIANLEFVGASLSPLEKVRLKRLSTSNKVMKVFRRNLERMFRREDGLSGDRVYPPRLFIAWAREYGSKKGRRHYHVVIGINGHRVGAAGPYHCLPDAFGNLSKRIAHVWLETLGLDGYEFVNRKGIIQLTIENDEEEDDVIIVSKESGEILNKAKKGNPKSLFGWLVYYPGNKGKKVASSGIYKSKMVNKVMSLKDMYWIYKVVSYMLKRETKEIPEAMREWVYEKERTFGCTITIGY